jgi:hypothetical protein
MVRLTAENRRWWILTTMTGALAMVLIDETVVSVALPRCWPGSSTCGCCPATWPWGPGSRW